jgi:hypothetical protein
MLGSKCPTMITRAVESQEASRASFHIERRMQRSPVWIEPAARMMKPEKKLCSTGQGIQTKVNAKQCRRPAEGSLARRSKTPMILTACSPESSIAGGV